MLLKRGCRFLWGSNLWPFSRSRLYLTAWVVSQPQIHRAYHKSHFTLKWPAWRYFLELCLLPSNIKVLKILTGSYLQPPDRDSVSRFLQRWFKAFPLYTHNTSNRLQLLRLAWSSFHPFTDCFLKPWKCGKYVSFKHLSVGFLCWLKSIFIPQNTAGLLR